MCFVPRAPEPPANLFLCFPCPQGWHPALVPSLHSEWTFHISPRPVSVRLSRMLPPPLALSPQLLRACACCVLSRFSSVWLCAILWTVAHQTPLSVGFSRQKYWSELPFPPPQDLPNTTTAPMSLTSPALTGVFFTTSAPWEACTQGMGHEKIVLRVLGPSQKLALIRPFQGNSSPASRPPDLLWETAYESCLHHNTPGYSEQPCHSWDGSSWQLSAGSTFATCFWLKKDTLFRVMSHSRDGPWTMTGQWSRTKAQPSPPNVCCCSVTKLCPTLQPHGLQHARLPCPSPSPGACSNSCPLSQWCHPTISSSVVPFSSCLQSFPASGSFPMSWLFASGGQSIGALASASVLPVNIPDWFPLGLTGLISLLSKGPSDINSLVLNLLYGSTVTLIHD